MPSPGYLTPALRESLLPGVPGFVGTGARIQSEQVPGFRRNTQLSPESGPPAAPRSLAGSAFIASGALLIVRVQPCSDSPRDHDPIRIERTPSGPAGLYLDPVDGCEEDRPLGVEVEARPLLPEEAWLTCITLQTR